METLSSNRRTCPCNARLAEWLSTVLTNQRARFDPVNEYQIKVDDEINLLCDTQVPYDGREKRLEFWGCRMGRTLDLQSGRQRSLLCCSTKPYETFMDDVRFCNPGNTVRFRARAPTTVLTIPTHVAMLSTNWVRENRLIHRVWNPKKLVRLQPP